jgi:hypothetical protein
VNIRPARPDAADRWPLYLGLVALVILAAVAMGLWRDRNTPVPNPAPKAAPKPAQMIAAAATGNASASPKAVELQYAPGKEPSGLLADAFEAATGHRKGYFSVEDGDEMMTVPARIVQLPSGYALITETTNQTGCHACLGILGIHYFRKESGGIVLAGKPLEVGDKWGEPPKWRLTKAFTTSPALLLAVNDHGQGVFDDDGWLIELAPAGPAVSDEITTRWEDEGAPDPYGRPACTLKGRIVNIRKDIGFDVRFSGTASAADRFRKRNGKFVIVSGVDWDHPCANASPPPDPGPSPG